MKGVNLQWGQQDPSGLPVIAIVSNDWMLPSHLQQWLAGVNVAAYRLMAGVQRLVELIPAGKHIILGNEEEAYPGDLTADARFAHSVGYVVHYGAHSWNRWELYEQADLETFDIVDFHVNADSGQQAPATYGGKPVWVTEVETSPTAPGWNAVLTYMASSAVPAFAWGSNATRADINDYQELLARIVVMTTAGGTIVPDETQASGAEQQVLDQNAHIAQALYDVTKVLSNPQMAPLDSAGLLQDARAHVNALNPSKFTF